MAEEMNNLSKNQKLALAGLIVFGIFIIGLWAFNLNQQINGPLAQKTLKSAASNSDQAAAAVSEEEKQKTRDTDGDGLFDWDELNVYKTSPYIADSDSDGISDGAEVAGNTNPNCPQGKSCGSTMIPAPDNSAGMAIGEISASEEESIDLLAGQSDAESLRRMLLNAGLDKADLDQISDEILLNTYRDMIASSTE